MPYVVNKEAGHKEKTQKGVQKPTKEGEEERKVGGSGGKDVQKNAGPQVAWMHAYVLCRITRHRDLERGAEQRALVALAARPEGAIYCPLLRSIGPLVFSG